MELIEVERAQDPLSKSFRCGKTIYIRMSNVRIRRRNTIYLLPVQPTTSVKYNYSPYNECQGAARSDPREI